MDGYSPRLEISRIRPNLYICGYQAHTKTNFDQIGITHAVDVSNSGVLHFPTVEYLTIPIRDREDQNISQFFDTATEWIKFAMQQNGKVLVFCRYGISRSATLCIMYLVIHEQLDLRSAYNTVKGVRNFIHPNRGFRAQMIAYTKQMSGRLLEDEDAYVFRRSSRMSSSSRSRGTKRRRMSASGTNAAVWTKVIQLMISAYETQASIKDSGAPQCSVEQN